MQYPIFLSPAQVARLLGIGKTSVWLKIKTGEFIVAKMGRSTKITLPSVIRYVEKCLQEGSARSVVAGLQGETGDANHQVIIERLMLALCNTHSKPNEHQEEPSPHTGLNDYSFDKSEFVEKNLGGAL